MATKQKHRLKGFEGTRDYVRAVCADCDFKGVPAGTPDNALDSFVIHEKETAK